MLLSDPLPLYQVTLFLGTLEALLQYGDVEHREQKSHHGAKERNYGALGAANQTKMPVLWKERGAVLCRAPSRGSVAAEMRGCIAVAPAYYKVNGLTDHKNEVNPCPDPDYSSLMSLFSM